MAVTHTVRSLPPPAAKSRFIPDRGLVLHLYPLALVVRLSTNLYGEMNRALLVPSGMSHPMEYGTGCHPLAPVAVLVQWCAGGLGLVWRRKRCLVRGTAEIGTGACVAF